MNAKKQGAGKSRHQDTSSHDWLTPITEDAPCGADLEYDPEYVVLSAKTIVQPDAQYGNFVGSSEPVNWSDIDRDCRRLMLRSKDIRLAVLFARCRTRLAGAAGLGEGLALLASWLDLYPEAIHPQLAVDSDRDAALEIRANAIQELTDSDGLLADLREIALTRSSAARLQVRDVERAFARPRPADALAPESVTRQLDDLQIQNPAVLSGFGQALASLEAVEKWNATHLEAFAPDLSALDRLLRRLVRSTEPQTGANAESDETIVGDACASDADETPEASAPAHSGVSTLLADQEPAGRSTPAPLADRHTALEQIRQARLWFETHEPSSPIPVLLRRAEHCVGKRYAEIVQTIPADLLAQWDVDR
ncbi:type VI secretion system ImpA family N-terminal domain-containing protein [Paraburkholderia fungorum]|uniref:type VI secretion system protein TssA n=1 Tax=Paraburkholderia fungorum TaxID=134537 RepID=UPI0038BB5D4C